jgi:hypothetical protein
MSEAMLTVVSFERNQKNPDLVHREENDEFGSF